VFTDVMLCNLVNGYQRFRETCCLHLQGRSGKHTSTWNMEMAYYSEMLVATTQLYITKDRTAVRTNTAACNSVQTVPGTPRIPGSISVTARDKPKHNQRNVVAGLEGYYSRPCGPLPTSKQYWTATEDKPVLLTARQ
jgi:CheY-like chemotaxis protein